MSTSPDLGIPFVAAQQEQPEITHNEAILMMSATLIGVISIGLNTPPGSPADGDNYVVGTAPTGAWAGRANCVAIRSSGGWRFVPDRDSNGTIITMGARQAGLKVFDKFSQSFMAWDGSAWVGLASVPGTPAHYGQRSIAGNTTVIAVTAAVDSTLSTNSDYIQVTGIFGIAPDGENNGITQQTNSFTIARDGPYRIEFWANCKSNTNNTQLAFKFAVNGVIQAVRRPKIYMRNVGEVHGGSAFSYVELQAGDVLTLWIASTQSANVTIEDAVFGVVSLQGTQQDGGGGATALPDLTDVELDSSLSDGDALVYDSDTGKWINQPQGGFGGIITNAEIVEYNETTATAASGNILRADGGIQAYTMTANTAFTFDLTDGQSLTLHLNGGDTWTATWPTITWVGGGAPTLTAADVLEFWYFDSTLFGAYVGDV